MKFVIFFCFFFASKFKIKNKKIMELIDKTADGVKSTFRFDKIISIALIALIVFVLYKIFVKQKVVLTTASGDIEGTISTDLHSPIGFKKGNEEE